MVSVGRQLNSLYHETITLRKTLADHALSFKFITGNKLLGM